MLLRESNVFSHVFLSFCPQGGFPCDHYSWCIGPHHTEISCAGPWPCNHPPPPPALFEGPASLLKWLPLYMAPSPVQGPLDMFIFLNFDLTVLGPSAWYVQTCSLWSTYSQQAGGWHLTGMHSFYFSFLICSFSSLRSQGKLDHICMLLFLQKFHWQNV